MTTAQALLLASRLEYRVNQIARRARRVSANLRALRATVVGEYSAAVGKRP